MAIAIRTGCGVELNLGKFAESSQDGILIELDGRVAYANHVIEAMLGYEPNSLCGRQLHTLSGPADCHRFGDASAPREPRFETTLRHRSKGLIPVELTRIECTWHALPAFMLIARDVSAVKRKDQALRQIIDLLPQPVFVKNAEGRFVLANKATAEFFGTTIEGLLGKRHSEFHLQPDQSARFHATDCAVLQDGAPRSLQEEAVLDAQGRRHILQATKIPFLIEEGQPLGVLAVVTNLTERKQAEHALAISEQRLRYSLNYANLGNWDWDLQTGELYWSERVAPLFGYKSGAVATTYEAFLAAVHGEDRQQVDEAVQASLDTGRDYTTEFRVVWPDGSIHWLHAAGGAVFDDRGKAVRMMGVVQDITQRRLTEQALLESERKYRALMENASDAILLATPAGWLVDANRRAEELFGYSREELLCMHASAIHPREDHPVLNAALRDLSTKGQSLYEHLILHKDGRVTNAEVAANAIDYQGQRILMAIFRDTTERKRMERQRLAQAKAQRDILVHEVHHRIKNNLQGVVGLLRQHISRHGELQAPLESAIGQVNTMALVHGLLGRDHSERVLLCDMVTAICHSARGMTGRAIEPSLQVQVRTPHQINRDEAVPLALIINELIFNAVKHQPWPGRSVEVNVHDRREGAQITILTPNARLPDDFDFAAGKGLGTGLRLIKSLLPPSGCRLLMNDGTDGVVTQLQLVPPVIVGNERRVGPPLEP